MALARVSVSKALLAQPARALSSGSLPSYVLNTPAYEQGKLSNGVRVASEVGAGELATVGVYIDAGSRFESGKTNGAAHLFEHLSFKGTASRAKAQLESEIAALGGQFSACTGRENTSYTAQVLKKDVPKALELLSDMLQNSVVDAAALDAERDVVLGELNALSFSEVVSNNLHEVAFQGSGLASSVYGPKANIKSITRDDLVAYAKTYFTGPRVVVAGAGAVTQAQLTELADKYFGKLPSASPAGFAPAVDKPLFTGADIRVREDTIPNAHMAVGFETGGWTDKYFFPLLVIQTLLGHWQSTSAFGSDVYSSLCRRLAEENTVHSVKAFTNTYKDTGLLGVYAVCEPTKAQATLYAIMYELGRLTHKVTDEEVARAKTQLKTNYLAHVTGAANIADNIGKQVLSFGRRIPAAEVFARIDAVDTSNVVEAAREYIDDKELVVSGLGNVHEMPDYNWLRRRTYWMRT